MIAAEPPGGGPGLDVDQRPITVKPRDQRADVDQADQLHHAEPQRPAQPLLRAEHRRLGAGGRLEGAARLRQQNAAGVVSLTSRVVRSNSDACSSRSRERMETDNADWTRCRRRAALVKFSLLGDGDEVLQVPQFHN